MDILNTTLAGLAVIGVVNVIGFYMPNMNSKMKFAIAFLTAFAIAFIPVNVSNMLLIKAKFALEIAFASSGLYKLTQNKEVKY